MIENKQLNTINQIYDNNYSVPKKDSSKIQLMGAQLTDTVKKTWDFGRIFLKSLVCDTANPEKPGESFPPMFPFKGLVSSLRSLSPSSAGAYVANQIRNNPLETLSLTVSILASNNVISQTSSVILFNEYYKIVKSGIDLSKIFLSSEYRRGDLTLNALFALCDALYLFESINEFYSSSRLNREKRQIVPMSDENRASPPPTYHRQTNHLFNQCTVGFNYGQKEKCDKLLSTLSPEVRSHVGYQIIDSYPLVQCYFAYEYGSPHIMRNSTIAEMFLKRALVEQNAIAKQIDNKEAVIGVYQQFLEDLPDYKFCDPQGTPFRSSCSITEKKLHFLDKYIDIQRKPEIFPDYAAIVGAKTMHEKGNLGENRTILIADQRLDAEHLPRPQKITQYDAEELEEMCSSEGFKDGPFSRTNLDICCDRNKVNLFHGNVDTSLLQNIAPEANIVFVQERVGSSSIENLNLVSEKVDCVSISAGPYSVNPNQGRDYFNWKNAIKYFTDQEIPVFIAAGNEGIALDEKNTLMRLVHDPDLKGRLVVVGATNYEDGLEQVVYNYPTFDTPHFLFAPGYGICANGIENIMMKTQGTSMATPIVAASYALLKEAFPAMSADEILNFLHLGAHKIGDHSRRIDLENSMKLMREH